MSTYLQAILINSPQRPPQLPRKQHQRIICSSQYRQKLVRAPNYSYARRPTCFHKTERERPKFQLDVWNDAAQGPHSWRMKQQKKERICACVITAHTPTLLHAWMNCSLLMRRKRFSTWHATNQKLLYAWTWSEWLYGQWQCAGEPIGSCGRCFICFRSEFFCRWFFTAGKFHQQSTHTVSDVWVVSPLVLALQLPVSQCLDDVVTFLNSYLLLSHDNHVAVCLCHQARR